MNNIEYMDRLEKSLEGYFDLERDIAIDNVNFDLHGKFYQRSAKYMMLKQAEIYAFQTNEHIFYKKLDGRLNENEISFYHNFLKENVDRFLNVNNEHMSTIITILFSTTEELDESTIKAVKKFKFYKSFKFGLNGWVNARLIIVNPLTHKIYTNKLGKGEAEKFLFKLNN